MIQIEFVSFFQAILSSLTLFLSSRPIIYFVGLFLLIGVCSALGKLIKI